MSQYDKEVMTMTMEGLTPVETPPTGGGGFWVRVAENVRKTPGQWFRVDRDDLKPKSAEVVAARINGGRYGEELEACVRQGVIYLRASEK